MKCADKCGLEIPAVCEAGKVTAYYIGSQKTAEPGFSFRLYNVAGPHLLDGSTVTVDTLVENGIPINDMTAMEIEREVAAIKRYLGME